MSNETKGGITRLGDLIGGDARWDVDIQGGVIENIAINSYDMPDGGALQDTDRIPVERNGVGYYIEGSEIGGSGVNVLTPEDFGCKGEFIARSQGIWDGTYFSDANFDFTDEHIGWSFWQDANLRTITAVTVDGKATLSPAGYGTTGINWRAMGQDDTVYFQRFLNACSPDYNPATPDVTPPETVIGLNGALRFGKVGLLTPGKIYPVSNSSASYSGGKLSAVIVPRRIALTCLSNAEHGVTIQLVPGSYGHCMSNLSTTSYSDFMVLKNFTILCDGDYSPNSLDGLHIHNPYGNYDKVDPYNRFENIRVERPKRHGIYVEGKGELKLRDCDVFNSGEYGLLAKGQYDVSVIGGQFGATGKTGIRIDSPGPIQITGVKAFYTGVNGGSNDEDCAGIVIEATSGDAFSGGASITEFEVQETRGVGLLIKVRNCTVRGVIQDPNRAPIGSPTGRPTVKSAVYLKGQNASSNNLDIFVMPALTAYETPNWPADTSIIHIDGDAPFNSTNGGPQNNTGTVEYPVNSILPGGGIFDGIEFTGTGTPFSGGGCTNGKNPHLTLNGVPFADVLGTAPASGDLFEVLDVSDTSAGAGGTKKLVEFSNISGGGGMAIGGGVTGSTDSRVLFVGASSTLDDDAGLTYDVTNGIFAVTGTSIQKAAFFDPSRIFLSEATGNGAARIELKPVDSLASDRTQRLPDKDGTIAMADNVVALTDAATVTPNSATTDIGLLTTLSQNTTIANPTGTPVHGQRLTIRVKSTTSRTLTFGSQYRGSTDTPLPTATSGGGLTDYIGFMWNATDSKWDYIAKNFGF